MADQSAFDRKQIETSAMSETTGILEQLNLPPAFVSFLRKNQRMLWAIVIVAAVSVTPAPRSNCEATILRIP